MLASWSDKLRSKFARKGISNWIGRPRNIIKPRHISMDPMVHSKETEEVRGGGVGGGTPPAFPKGTRLTPVLSCPFYLT
jgi:hypothetical protein